MYLPESIADKNIEEMDMDEFLRLVAMADYARRMRIADLENRAAECTGKRSCQIKRGLAYGDGIRISPVCCDGDR